MLRKVFESVLSSSPDAVGPSGILSPSTSSSVNKPDKSPSAATSPRRRSAPPPPQPIHLTPSKTSKEFRRLKRQCIRKGRLFVDEEFPPNNKSLFMQEESGAGNLEIEWRRPGEIVDDPKLFVEGASPCDVTQGILGNCWFVSACSALTHNDALLQKVIPDADGQEWTPANFYCGIFQFCFWRFGRWVDVIVDDLLPTKDGQLLFARSKTPNEFWSALLEKAFAKLYGCYESLVGGQLADALIELSGGVAETLNVRKFLRNAPQQFPGNGLGLLRDEFVGTQNGQKLDQNSAKSGTEMLADTHGAKLLFRKLKYAFDREALIVAAIAAKKEEIERSLDCGLVMGHAYAVTAIRYIHLDALELDNDEEEYEEKRVCIRRRQAMVRLQNPWGMKEWNGPWSDGSAEWEQVTDEQKQRLGITVDEDGEFWMPWEEFVRYFTDISVCQLLNIGALTECKEQRQMGMSMRMHNTASRRSNVTVGMPEKRWQEWTFFGRWCSNGVKPGAPKDRAGGSANFPATFCQNPQFAFDVCERDGPAELMVALTQRDEGSPFDGGKAEKDQKRAKRSQKGQGARSREPLVVIGIHLMRVELNRRHRIHQAINPVASTDYLSSRSIHLHIDQLPPGRYILMPTTYAPREESEFMLRMYSPSQLHPEELREDMPKSCCRRRTRGVTRVRILEAELHRMISFRESELFCKLTDQSGAHAHCCTMLASALPGLPAKFHDSFVFHNHSLRHRFTLALFEQRKPFQRKNRWLGSAKVEVIGDNESTGEQKVELIGAREKGKDSGRKVIGTVRIEISSYDDPFYI